MITLAATHRSRRTSPCSPRSCARRRCGSAVGLYQYLGIEIAIWMIYALGFNLFFGYGGLHSFGHGAFSASAPMPSGCSSTMSR